MIIRNSVLALAMAAAFAGCATTTPEEQAAAAATPPGTRTTPGSSTTGTGRGPTAVPPVGISGGGQQSRPDLKRSVYYEFDKYDVKPEYRALIQSHAAWLKANPQARITIEGNADEQGSREYNVALGQRRAESVVKMLVLLGAKPEQIEAVSWGEEKPRASGHDEKSWSENRRSDFATR
jgi:peptidoglycan-associated lipoprotein